MFKKGETYHILQGPGEPYKIHVLEIVDGQYVVYKWYGRHKQWWHYNVEHEDILQVRIVRAGEQVNL